MAGGFGVAGSGGDGTMRGDGQAARIGGVAGVGRSPVERQQSIERLDFGPSDPADDVGQVGFRVDPELVPKNWTDGLALDLISNTRERIRRR